MEIQEITEHLKNDSLSPSDLAECYTQLAGWYSYYGQMMKKVKEDKPAKWLELKGKHLLNQEGKTVVKPHSDTMTEMLWEASEEGQKEIALTWELKRIKQMMSAINSRLYIANMEARSQY